MKAVITGATGMLGMALAAECAGRGIGVTAVARPGSANLERLSAIPGIRIIECGLDDLINLAGMAGEPHDMFFHLGWAHTDREGRSDPEKQQANIAYCLAAVLAAKQLGCTVFTGAGSQAEYGRVEGAIPPTMRVNPETAYGTAKFASGRLSGMLCSRLGIRHVWTRIFSVYGPNDGPDTMVSYCIKTLLKGGKPQLTDCTQLWDYLYCSDAAAALLLAASKGKDKAVYNIGSGIARPLVEYVTQLRDAVDPRLELGIGEKERAPGQVTHLCADISTLAADTGFEPAVRFSDGIRQTIKWHKENKR